jgi:hypothetical protein
MPYPGRRSADQVPHAFALHPLLIAQRRHGPTPESLRDLPALGLVRHLAVRHRRLPPKRADSERYVSRWVSRRSRGSRASAHRRGHCPGRADLVQQVHGGPKHGLPGTSGCAASRKARLILL